MGLLFNDKVTKKCNLWVYKQCTKALFIKDLVNNYGLEKKKKKGKRRKIKHGHANAQCESVISIGKNCQLIP